MISSENASLEVREKITCFLFWYRIATLVLVVVLTVAGITFVALVPLAVAIAYNAFIMRFRADILSLVRSYPYLLLIDIPLQSFFYIETVRIEEVYF